MRRKTFIAVALSLLIVLQASLSFAWPRPIFRKSTVSYGSSTSQSWVDWSEDNQQSLSCDYSKTYVCIFDGSNPGDDDTGYGVTSGSNLILTESGNVPAATGSPLYRQLTQASSQRFSIPVTLQNHLFNAPDWLVMFKISAYSTSGNGMLLAWNNTSAMSGFAFRKGSLGFYEVEAPGLSGGTTVSGDSGANEVYVACWRKSTGTTRTRFGFSVGSKITSWAGLSANNVSSGGGAAFNINAASVGLIGQRSGAEYITCKLHYIIISTQPEFFISD